MNLREELKRRIILEYFTELLVDGGLRRGYPVFRAPAVFEEYELATGEIQRHIRTSSASNGFERLKERCADNKVAVLRLLLLFTFLGRSIIAGDCHLHLVRRIGCVLRLLHHWKLGVDAVAHVAIDGGSELLRLVSSCEFGGGIESALLGRRLGVSPEEFRYDFGVLAIVERLCDNSAGTIPAEETSLVANDKDGEGVKTMLTSHRHGGIEDGSLEVCMITDI